MNLIVYTKLNCMKTQLKKLLSQVFDNYQERFFLKSSRLIFSYSLPAVIVILSAGISVGTCGQEKQNSNICNKSGNFSFISICCRRQETLRNL